MYKFSSCGKERSGFPNCGWFIKMRKRVEESKQRNDVMLDLNEAVGITPPQPEEKPVGAALSRRCLWASFTLKPPHKRCSSGSCFLCISTPVNLKHLSEWHRWVNLTQSPQLSSGGHCGQVRWGSRVLPPLLLLPPTRGCHRMMGAEEGKEDMTGLGKKSQSSTPWIWTHGCEYCLPAWAGSSDCPSHPSVRTMQQHWRAQGQEHFLENCHCFCILANVASAQWTQISWVLDVGVCCNRVALAVGKGRAGSKA